MSEFYPEAGVYNPATAPREIVDIGTGRSAGHGQQRQDVAVTFGETDLSPTEYIRRMSQAQDAAAATFAPDTVGAHVVGQDLRHLLAVSNRIQVQLELLALYATGAEALPLRSPEALAALQRLSAFAEALQKEVAPLMEAAHQFYLQAGWQAVSTQDHLSQVKAQVEAEKKRIAEAEAEVARLQSELEQARQKRLAQLRDDLEAEGLIVVKKGEE